MDETLFLSSIHKKIHFSEIVRKNDENFILALSCLAYSLSFKCRICHLDPDFVQRNPEKIMNRITKQWVPF